MRTPHGQIYNLHSTLLKQSHLLIAGATGSGKSVLINGLISAALYTPPNETNFILIDPKRVELGLFKNVPHVLKYASEPEEFVPALEYALEKIETRYKKMSRSGVRIYDGGHIYVIIDELADLMCTDKKHVMPLIQRVCQIGRAANVHVIAATQCPLVTVIPTAIKVNFDARVGLRTRSAQDSRNILGFNGCESLPRYGYGYAMLPGLNPVKVEIPLVSDEEIQRLIEHWKSPKNKFARKLFNLFGGEASKK